MKNKLFIFSALIISAFIFSGCAVVNQNQVYQELKVTPTKVNQETGDDTEDELLKQLDADKDTNFDSEFTQIQTEVQ